VHATAVPAFSDGKLRFLRSAVKSEVDRAK
jgi:hypothetical protein